MIQTVIKLVRVRLSMLTAVSPLPQQPSPDTAERIGYPTRFEPVSLGTVFAWRPKSVPNLSCSRWAALDKARPLMVRFAPSPVAQTIPTARMLISLVSTVLLFTLPALAAPTPGGAGSKPKSSPDISGTLSVVPNTVHGELLVSPASSFDDWGDRNFWEFSGSFVNEYLYVARFAHLYLDLPLPRLSMYQEGTR